LKPRCRTAAPETGGYGLLGGSVLVPVEARLSRPVIARAGEAACRVAVARGDVPWGWEAPDTLPTGGVIRGRDAVLEQ
jgi:hypothetical protein